MAFESNTSTTPATPATAQQPAPAARQRWRLRLRTLALVIAVLGFGLLAAHWQLQATATDDSGNAIARWVNNILPFGLVVYVGLHFARKLPPSVAGVVAALVIVSYVNFQAHDAVSEDREANASIARAMQLSTKIKSGTAVSDQEVRDASVGPLEPLLLAQAMNAREVIAIDAVYVKGTQGLHFDQMLAPESLASPGGRAQVRDQLKRWQQASVAYKAGLDTAAANGRQRIEAAQAQMPAAMAGATRGYDQSAARTRANVDGQLASIKEMGEGITAILDLLDANPGGYALYKGPPEQLEWRNPATLARYNALLKAIQASGQRLAQADAQQAQAARVDTMEGLAKP